MEYEFSIDWFSMRIPFWKSIIDAQQPTKILEIGSYEGRSTSYIIETCSQYSPIHVYCIDTWQGSDEHKVQSIDNTFLFDRFKHNANTAIERANNDVKLYVAPGTSLIELARLNTMDEYIGYFDLVYIDGSHYASDVMVDACLTYPLLREGGVMIFDDYTWDTSSLEENIRHDPLIHPRFGADSFFAVYADKMLKMNFADDDGKPIDDTYQLYLVKNTSNQRKI